MSWTEVPGYQDMSPEQTAGRRTDRICTADACVELQMRCLGPPSGVKPLRTKPRGTMVKPDRCACGAQG
ncbi:hypothetical protein NQZ68_027389 [Dissostichus eleginoides]|nr:hypothetical protein NQZ68_027389 [Dissostichus eleginoides]